MKKNSKILLILLAVFVLLIGIFLAVKLLNTASEDVEESTDETFTTLFTIDESDISEIRYTYGQESISLIRQEDTWQFADDPDFPVDSARINTMLSELAEVKLYQQIDSEEDFGFASDGIDVTVTAGETFHFVLGMENSQISKVYLLTDSSEIYTTAVSLKKAFSFAKEDLLLADEMPEIATEDILSMTVENGENSYTISNVEEQFTYYSYSYRMENSAGTTPLDSEKTQNFLLNVTDPQFYCDDPTPDASEVSEAGFDQPVTISFTYAVETEADEDGETETEEYSYRIFLGNEFIEQETGNVYRYLMLEDSSMLFYLTKDVADDILSPTLSELTPDAMCEISFYQLRDFSFTFDDESHTATRKTVDDETVCTFDGTEVNYGYIESFLLDLTNIQSEGACTEELLAGTPIFTAHFVVEYEDTSAEYDLEIYEYNANFHVASFSGRQDKMLISNRDVSAISDSLAELKENIAR